MFRFFRPSSLFYSPDGGAGGAADNSATMDNGGGEALRISPDQLIHVEGSPTPIKFADYRKDYVPQSDYTRGRQQFAEERKKFETEKAEATRILLEHAKRIAEKGKGGGGNTQATDPFQALRGKPQVDGDTVAELISAIQNKGLMPIVNAIQQRDGHLKKLTEQLQALGQVVEGFQAQGQAGRTGRMLKSVARDLGLPEDSDALEFLREVHGSYDYDENEDEAKTFSENAKKRVESLRRMFRNLDKEDAKRARERLIAGQGSGKAPGGKPRKFETADELAERWGAAFGLSD